MYDERDSHGKSVSKYKAFLWPSRNDRVRKVTSPNMARKHENVERVGTNNMLKWFILVSLGVLEWFMFHDRINNDRNIIAS